MRLIRGDDGGIIAPLTGRVLTAKDFLSVYSSIWDTATPGSLLYLRQTMSDHQRLQLSMAALLLSKIAAGELVDAPVTRDVGSGTSGQQLSFQFMEE